jgi:hypothetical protein
MTTRKSSLQKEAELYGALSEKIYPFVLAIALGLTIFMATGGVTFGPPEFRDPANQMYRLLWWASLACIPIRWLSLWGEEKNYRRKKHVKLNPFWVGWTITKAMLVMIVAILFFMVLR